MFEERIPVIDSLGRWVGDFIPSGGGCGLFILLLLLALMACVAPVLYTFLLPLFLVLGLLGLLYRTAKGGERLGGKGLVVGWISWLVLLLICIFWFIDDGAREFTWGLSRFIWDIFF